MFNMMMPIDAYLAPRKSIVGARIEFAHIGKQMAILKSANISNLLLDKRRTLNVSGDRLNG